MSITVKIIIAYFSGVVSCLFVMMAITIGMLLWKKHKYTGIPTDKMLSEMDGREEGNGEMKGTETVTLLWLQDPDWLLQPRVNFPSRTEMERWMARKLEENGILSCEFTYQQGVNHKFWNVMADGMRVGIAALRNDKTMNK